MSGVIETAKDRAPKLRMSPARQRAIDKLKSGLSLIAEKNPEQETVYAFSDGVQVSQDVVRRLFKYDVFEPVGDGLFGDSQSFRLREAPL